MKRVLRGLRTALDALYLAAAMLAALCLACIAVVVLAQVIARWSGALIPAAEEIAGYLMAAATFLALAWTLRTSGHIRVTLLIRHLSLRLRMLQEILVLLLASALLAYISWAAITLVVESWQYGDVSSGHVAIPLWIPQLPMATGLVILAIAMVDELVSTVAGNRPSYFENDHSFEASKQDAAE